MTEFERKYFDLNTQACFQRIDESSYLDLELEKLFEFIDCTDSAVGRQYLYNQMRTIPSNTNTKMQEDFLHLYNIDSVFRDNVSKQISTLDHPDAYNICAVINNQHSPYSKNKRIAFFVLQFLPTLFLLLFLVSSNSLLLIGLVVSFACNMGIHFNSKKLSFDYSDSIPQLYKLINTAQKLNIIIGDKTDFNIQDSLKKLKFLKFKCSIFRLNAKMTGDLAILAWLISEFFRIFFLIEPLNLDKIFLLIQKENKALENTFRYVGQIDTYQSIHRLRDKVPFYCLPLFVDNKANLTALNIYNPLIDNCVKNSFELKNDSFLIMGSNMSGKTTFIRSVGINVLMAQTLNTCFSQSLVLNRQKIYTSISIKDDISKKQSYYLSEVLRMKDIVEHTSNNCNLILLDELFKGTNTEERIACAQAILKHLTNNPQNRIFVATHDFQLAEILKGRLTPIYFTENISDNELSFSYQISYEDLGQKNAIKILQLYNFPDNVIREALLQVKHGD